MGPVGLQLVVLDEVDAGLDEFTHDFRQFLGAEPDAGLDNRADHHAGVAAHELARAREPERRAGVAIGERPGEVQVHELDRGEIAHLEEVARHCGLKVRDGGAEVVQREREADHAAADVGGVALRPR